MNLEDLVFQKVNQKYTVNETSSINDKSPYKLMWFSASRKSCITVYVTLNVMILLVVIARVMNFLSFFMQTSMALHDNMFNAITKAKMLFFNENSAGK